ncbi:MAG: 3-deoxy-manno-octulosonate cytidylyltransferase [Gammaproteobacteria bacterium]|nr:3-deoxy-manno-octulosonate cytidylyltransferase [Gammaproteobacteria bacterium]MCH9744130.1 3-deoxy-manno-octulosonate cytidylyltransferase [Gammaproteobacteria bacterium]
MEFHVIIPVRYNATRFPGKPLVDIAGKPMVQHVYENAKESGAESVVIATDSDEIAKVAEGFGAPFCMTSEDHQSGTERLAEAVSALDYEDDEIVVNLQGDEPLMPPQVIKQVAEALDEHDNVKVSSVCEQLDNSDELLDPNAVKVALSRRHFALYFSRSIVPWQKGLIDKNQEMDFSHYYRHIGLYASRVSFLKEYVGMPACPFESLESLEQLRILWNGFKIFMTISENKIPPGVDTQEDLQKVLDYLKK